MAEHFNEHTMPITAALYGKKRPRKTPAREYSPRHHTTPVWEAITQTDLDRLAQAFPKTRRLAARRRSTRT